jgi:hypothetical protein
LTEPCTAGLEAVAQEEEKHTFPRIKW